MVRKSLFLFIPVALLGANQADAMLTRAAVPAASLLPLAQQQLLGAATRLASKKALTSYVARKPVLRQNPCMPQIHRREFFSGIKDKVSFNGRLPHETRNVLYPVKAAYIKRFNYTEWPQNPCVANPFFQKRYEHFMREGSWMIPAYVKALATSRPLASFSHWGKRTMGWLPYRAYIVDNFLPGSPEMRKYEGARKLFNPEYLGSDVLLPYITNQLDGIKNPSNSTELDRNVIDGDIIEVSDNPKARQDADIIDAEIVSKNVTDNVEEVPR